MLENINLGIEFTSHNIDPVVPSPEYVGAQTGDLTFIIIATLVLLGVISVFLLGIRKLTLLNTTTQGLHVRMDSKSNQNLKPIFSGIFAAILAVMLICLCCLSTKAFAKNNEANIDVTPDKIQVVVDGDTGTLQEAVFNFENTSDNYYLFDKTTSMSLTPEAATITQAADWDLQLTALETDLFSGTPDGSDYIVPGDVVTLMPHTSAQAVLKFNKSDFEIAKKLVGIQVFTLTMIPDQRVVGVPTAPDSLVYNGQSQTAIAETEAYTVTYGSGTNADTYNAVVTLKSDYKWPDKSTAPQTIPWSIAPLPVSLSWDTPTLTYTGEAQHPTASITNVKGSDIVTVATYSYPEGYDGISAKEQKVNVATLSGTSASNYTLEGATGNEKIYTIAKKALTITADNKEKMEGGDEPELTATFNGLVHEESFVLGTDYSISRQTATEEHVGDTFDITVAVSQGSQVAENYSITTVKGRLTIIPKNPVITPEAKSKTYGTSVDPTLTATVENADEGFPLVIGTDYTLSREAGENAGEYKITVTLNETEHVSHYEKIDCKEGTFTINKRAAIFKWSNETFTYNKNRQHPTATITNKVLEDDVNVDQYIGVDSNMRSAGTQKCKVYWLVGKSADNYSLDDITNFKAYTINKADIAMDLSVNGDSVTQPRNYQDVKLQHTLSITFGPEILGLMELSYQWYEAASYEGQQSEISGATEDTYNILKDSYVGQKYYFLKVTINPHDNNFNITSKTSTNEKYVKFVYTKMSFNDQLTNTTTDLYTKYGTNLLYKGETSDETAEIPTVAKPEFVFDGWFTGASDGSRVVDFEKQIVTETIEGYVKNGFWANIEAKTIYAHFYQAQYMTFTNQVEGENTISFNFTVNSWSNLPSLILRVSTDAETWHVIQTDVSGVFEVAKLSALNDKVYVAGYNPNGFSSNTRVGTFSSTGKFSVSGNYMALIDYTRDDITAIPNDYCFQQLFKDCSNLTSVPKLDFTFDKETQSHCLNQMFENCSLINYLEVTFKQWPENGFQDWVKGIASNGTFICPDELEWKVSYSPSVIFIDEEPAYDFCPVNFHNNKGEARVYFEKNSQQDISKAIFYVGDEKDYNDYKIVPLDIWFGNIPWESLVFNIDSVECTNSFLSWTENIRSLDYFFYDWMFFKNLDKCLDLSNWNVINVATCNDCFYGCGFGSINLTGWKLEKCTKMQGMFSNSSIINIIADKDTDFSDTEKIDGNNMFYRCFNLPGFSPDSVDNKKAKNWQNGGYFTTEDSGEVYIDGQGNAKFYTVKDNLVYIDRNLVFSDYKTWDATKITSVEFTDSFKNDWMPNVASTEYWFSNSNIANINIEFDGKKLKKTNNMFSSCKKLTNVSLSISNNSVLEDCSSMFSGCEILATTSGTIPITNVKYATMMFYGCFKLKSVFDSQSWKLNNIENTSLMFCSCQELTTLDVSEWIETSGTNSNNLNCSGMFSGCLALQYIYCKNSTDWSRIAISSGSMFDGCTSLPRYSGSNPNDATWAKPWNGTEGYFTIQS